MKDMMRYGYIVSGIKVRLTKDRTIQQFVDLGGFTGWVNPTQEVIDAIRKGWVEQPEHCGTLQPDEDGNVEFKVFTKSMMKKIRDMYFTMLKNEIMELESETYE